MKTMSSVAILMFTIAAMLHTAACSDPTDGDADADGDGDGDGDGDTDADADSDGDGDTDADADADGDGDGDGDTDADADADGDGDGDTDADADADGDGDGDGDADADADSDADSDGDGDGGSGDLCVDVSGDYGGCEMFLGYGFDGTQCAPFSGCACEPNCDHFSDDITACTSACVDEGHCNDSLMRGVYLAPDPFGEGDHCDEVYLCSDAAATDLITEVFPSASCSDTFEFCTTPEMCLVISSGAINPNRWEQLCETTLIQGVSDVVCVVWGP